MMLMEVADEEADEEREHRRRLSPSDFEKLAIVGRGAFGEVQIVRMKGGVLNDEIYAMKRMLKEAMIL